VNCKKCDDTGSCFETRWYVDEFRGYGLIEDVYDYWCNCSIGRHLRAKDEERLAKEEEEFKQKCGLDYVGF